MTFGGYGQHQLDSVQLIDFAGAWIKVDRHDIGRGVDPPQFTEHALAGDMVGQAGERLHADDVGDTGFYQLDHFGGQ